MTGLGLFAPHFPPGDSPRFQLEASSRKDAEAQTKNRDQGMATVPTALSVATARAARLAPGPPPASDAEENARPVPDRHRARRPVAPRGYGRDIDDQLDAQIWRSGTGRKDKGGEVIDDDTGIVISEAGEIIEDERGLPHVGREHLHRFFHGVWGNRDFNFLSWFPSPQISPGLQ
jgi:hypothetical protein